MLNKFRTLGITLVGSFLIAASGWAGSAEDPAKVRPVTVSAGQGKKVFWEAPDDIANRDLISGQGGRENVPGDSGYQFVKEDLGATNPKFSVRDASGTKWKIKLGDEARPETVATRLVWAVGFHTDEDYFLPLVHVTGVPDHLKRGRKYIDPDGTMHNARLEREPSDLKKIGSWSWTDASLNGTREWNGLRVMMALINNWDLKDENNSIYEVGGKGRKNKDTKGDDASVIDAAGKTLIYVVSDLGASFGPTHIDLERKVDKGDLNKYRDSDFIRRLHGTMVDFNVPGAPSPIMAFNVPEYVRRRNMMWIGRDVPRADAKWMGSILGRLSDAQLQDAFRAGGYSPMQVQAFSALMRDRINSLLQL